MVAFLQHSVVAGYSSPEPALAGCLLVAQYSGHSIPASVGLANRKMAFLVLQAIRELAWERPLVVAD